MVQEAALTSFALYDIQGGPKSKLLSRIIIKPPLRLDFLKQFRLQHEQSDTISLY